jgi:CDP-paratose 2-epimerase
VRVVVTGGGGFVGSHVVERYARMGDEVLAVDALSRSAILGEHFFGRAASRYNWERVGSLPLVKREEVDVRDAPRIAAAMAGADCIFHTAAQVAVTTSVKDPRTDFETNVVGTVNVLEGARLSGADPVVIFCSTNKVYGDHVNEIPVREEPTRYEFADPRFIRGIPESFETDGTHHTPYGASKLAADLYVQEYARTYGLRTAVFRMSCIYGAHQFGLEDQGWVAHFALSALFGRPLTIYGDGKQVRDILFVDDLVDAYSSYVVRSRQLGSRVYNLGGGTQNTTSLLELLSALKTSLNRTASISYADWRAADQKVYISDTTRAKEELQWSPKVSPQTGVARMLAWGSTLRRTRAREPGVS